MPVRARNRAADRRCLDTQEWEIGKPVLSSNQAFLWRALRAAGVRTPVGGFGRLLRE